MGNSSARLLESSFGNEVPSAALIKLVRFSRADQYYNIYERFISSIRSPGLNLYAFSDIFKVKPVEAASTFPLLTGTGQNGLVDAYEALTTAAVCSKMSTAQRLQILFTLHDIDKDNRLSFYELILLLRSLLSALAKISGGRLLGHKELEQIAMVCFKKMDISIEDSAIEKCDFLKFCQSNPVVRKIAARINLLTTQNIASAVKPTKEEAVDYSRRIMKSSRFKNVEISSACEIENCEPQPFVSQLRKDYLNRQKESKKFDKALLLRLHASFHRLDTTRSGLVIKDEFYSLVGGKIDDCQNKNFKVSLVDIFQSVYPYANDKEIMRMLRWVDVTTHKAQQQIDKSNAFGDIDDVSSLFNFFDSDNVGKLSIIDVCQKILKSLNMSEDNILKILKVSKKSMHDTVDLLEFQKLIAGLSSYDIQISVQNSKQKSSQILL